MKRSVNKIPPFAALFASFSSADNKQQPEDVVLPEPEIVSRETTFSTHLKLDEDEAVELTDSDGGDTVVTREPAPAPNVFDTTDDSSPLASQLASEHKRRERLSGRKLPKPSTTRYMTVSNQKVRKGRGTRDQIANIRWIMEKARPYRPYLGLIG